ncbi:hypothetical protein BCR36DRAFT_347070 [Piromyces finnis]|uniref:Uncharacterized protein n=1 Tax=Piromyces finnis TaxID=1754191 RepID=A0A1Y1VFY7_9FUNG|nr:hypothetical protein BCR36DRAFT_347070 [Piromyces finnis]|eukprot:ORX55334.1 hypothetical protein BCR36DRAFT_347070 [Piromyces finnis]
MYKYPKKTQNIISYYIKTLPSNVIPKFPPIFIEFLKYYFNEQTEDNNGSTNNTNEIVKDTSSIKISLNRNSHLTSNVKRDSSNSSLNTFACKGTASKNISSIPLSRTKSIQSTYNNSINSIPSSYSETSSYYYNSNKRSLPGNLCLISKIQEFNEIQITLRELFLDVYNDDLLNQYFYPIFIDFSHENIFALWLKDDEDNESYNSSKGSPYWGFQTSRSSRSSTKHNSLMNTSLGIGSNILSSPVSIGQLPVVKIGLEKQRIGVIAKNLNSFLSLLTQTSFVNNVVRNYRIGGGDESTILSSEDSSDEEYNSIQDMIKYDGDGDDEEDLLENQIASNTSSTISLDGDELNYKITENTSELIDSSFLEEEEEEEEERSNENGTTKTDISNGNKGQCQKEVSNEQFTLENHEINDEKKDLEDGIENETQSHNYNESESTKDETKKGKDDYKTNNDNIDTVEEQFDNKNEIIYVKLTPETKPSENKQNEETKSNIENIEYYESDNKTLSSSISSRHNQCYHNRGEFGYDSEIKINNKDSMNVIVNDNSLPNSFPYNKRYTDDFERINKSEFNIRRYSYASSINSTLTTVSASPFAIRTMFQQQETQISYNQWFDEICKKDNINLDNSDEIEKKLLQEDSVLLRSSSLSSSRSNNRKYLSMDGYPLNYYDNKASSIRSSKGSSFIQSKHNQRPMSLWDSILDKNRQTAMDKSIPMMANSPSEKNMSTNTTNAMTENTEEKDSNTKELPSTSTTKYETDKVEKSKLHKKSSNKLSVKSISHTLSKSASAAPKQIKRKIKENASLQKLKLRDSKLKNKESFGHHHSNQKSTLYSKKLMNNNDMLPSTSSALSKNITSSSSRTKISSPLSKDTSSHSENYLNPRKNVPTTVTTMMTISNNINHTHNSSTISKTSPKIPSKLHQNISVHRYRTNSSPAPMYNTTNHSRIMNKDANVKQNNYLKPTITANKDNSKLPLGSDNQKSTNLEKPTLQINTNLSKKESKDTIKTAPAIIENNLFGNFFSVKKFPKFNGFNFFTSIPIVAKLLNLDTTKESESNTSATSNENKKEEMRSKPATNSKNNHPIAIAQQNNSHTTFEKSPEKSSLSTYTNNSGGGGGQGNGSNINYISSAAFASQILEKERQGIPEPEQWLQKQVKARAYAIAVANAVAKRNHTKKSHDYLPYTTKFTPTNHSRHPHHPKTSVVLPTDDILNKEVERKKLMEDEDYFIL